MSIYYNREKWLRLRLSAEAFFILRQLDFCAICYDEIHIKVL